MLRPVARMLAVTVLFAMGAPAEPPSFDTAAIETITQLKGKYSEAEGVFKVSLPRSDVKISVDGWQMPPFMGLTSWASFVAGQKADMMIMGDLVLFENEVPRVMSAALNAGIQVTALHNHFFFDKPRVYFMHIGGEGSLEALAKGVRACFEEVEKIRKKKKLPGSAFAGKALPKVSTISPKIIDDILGTTGEAKDGMYKVTLGRNVEMKCGCAVGKTMGVNTWAAFAGADDNAVVDGDFAVLEEELQGVLKTLRKAGINVVAIHHHMVGETPRTLFLHYWGRGSVQTLANAIKAALNTQKKTG